MTINFEVIIKKYKHVLLLSILILFHLLNNYFWIKEDACSGGCDVFHHMDWVITMHRSMEKVFDANLPVINKLQPILNVFFNDRGHIAWPRAIHFFTALAAFFTRDIIFFIRFSSIFYLVILIVGIFLLGKAIHSPAAGVISAYFISLYPAVFGLSRKFGLDFPLVAFTCLILYFLIRSDGFRNFYYSILFGIFFGVGTLIKLSCLLFVAGPFLFAFFYGLKNNKYLSKFFFNVAIALIIFLFISLIWWHKLFNHDGVGLLRAHVSIKERHILSQFKGGSFFEEYTFYLKAIYKNASALFFFVFLSSLGVFLKSLNEKKKILLCTLFLPYLIFSIILNKWSRFIFPVFVPMAVISAVGWLELPLKRKARQFILLAIFVVGFSQFFLYSYVSVPQSVAEDLYHPPKKNNHKAIMQNFSQEISVLCHGKERNIAVIEEDYFYGDDCVRLKNFLCASENKNNVFLSMLGVVPPQVEESFLSLVNDFQFLVAFSASEAAPVFTGLLIFSNPAQKEKTSKAIAAFQKYKIIKQDTLQPDGINIFLLKKL